MPKIRMRRDLLRAMAGTAGMFAVEAWSKRSSAQAPQPMASPNAPLNQNVPGGLERTPVNNAPANPLNKPNFEQIAGSVRILYTLALDLKNEVERINLNTTLPLDFVKKAGDIEKLAKQIKQRAKG